MIKPLACMTIFLSLPSFAVTFEDLKGSYDISGDPSLINVSLEVSRKGSLELQAFKSGKIVTCEGKGELKGAFLEAIMGCLDGVSFWQRIDLRKATDLKKFEAEIESTRFWGMRSGTYKFRKH